MQASYLTRFSFILLCLMQLVSCDRQSVMPESSTVVRSAQGGGLSVSVELSAENIKTSELLELIVTVVHPPGIKVTLPEVERNLGGFTVCESHSFEPKLEVNGNVKLVRSYLLEPDLAGDYVVPAIELVGRLEDGTHIVVASPEVAVNVVSVLTSSADTFQSIAPNVREERAVVPDLKWLALVIPAAVAFSCGLYWLRVKAKIPQRSQDVPSLSFDDSTFDSLGVVEVLSVIEQQFCQQMSSRFGSREYCRDFSSVIALLRNEGVATDVLEAVASQCDRWVYGVNQPRREVIATVSQQLESFSKEVQR